jgi:hypothetical protein
MSQQSCRYRPQDEVVIAGDRYARDPSPRTRRLFKDSIDALLAHVEIQRDLAIETAAALTGKDSHA